MYYLEFRCDLFNILQLICEFFFFLYLRIVILKSYMPIYQYEVILAYSLMKFFLSSFKLFSIKNFIIAIFSPKCNLISSTYFCAKVLPTVSSTLSCCDRIISSSVLLLSKLSKIFFKVAEFLLLRPSVHHECPLSRPSAIKYSKTY